MSDIPMPPPMPSGLMDAKGQPTQTGYKYFKSLGESARGQNSRLTAIEERYEIFGFTYEYPSAKDIVIRNIPYAFTVVSVTTKTSAGSCTVTPKINTTGITSTNGSATTSETERVATAANVGAAGDDLRFTISALSGVQDLDVTVKIQRA